LAATEENGGSLLIDRSLAATGTSQLVQYQLPDLASGHPHTDHHQHQPSYHAQECANAYGYIRLHAFFSLAGVPFGVDGETGEVIGS
jgi:hypothetical protein